MEELNKIIKEYIRLKKVKIKQSRHYSKLSFPFSEEEFLLSHHISIDLFRGKYPDIEKEKQKDYKRLLKRRKNAK